MKVKGDLKCYHCGYVSGQLIGDSDGPLSSRLFVPNPNDGHNRPLPVSGQRHHCARCGGPIYLDEIEVVRDRTFKCVVDPYETRPGRRPGKKVAAKSTAVPTTKHKQMERVCA